MAHAESTCVGSAALFGRKRLAGEVISDGKGGGIVIGGGRQSSQGARRRRIRISGQWAILPPAMKRRTRLLKHTAIESLTLSIEVFNRPSPTARTQGVLLNLEHSFEMLFKAVIWEDRARIEPKGGGNSYALRECLGILRGMGKLSEDEAVVGATIAGHRDAVQHQGAAVTEERLYLDAASGLRLFDDLLARCFGERLADHPDFASRMLPVSANPPREMYLLTDSDVQHIRGLLKRPQHRHAEALALLRTLVVSEQAAADPMKEPSPPSENQLKRVAKSSKKQKTGREFYPAWPD